MLRTACLIMEKSDPSALKRVKSIICSRVEAYSKDLLTKPSDEKNDIIEVAASRWTLMMGETVSAVVSP